MSTLTCDLFLRPRTFSGKYIFFNCQDACMSPYNSDTKRMRKALHASLRFYGDGVQQFEQTVHSEIDHVIARLNGAHDAVSGQDFENLVSDSILSVIHILVSIKTSISLYLEQSVCVCS